MSFRPASGLGLSRTPATQMRSARWLLLRGGRFLQALTCVRSTFTHRYGYGAEGSSDPTYSGLRHRLCRFGRLGRAPPDLADRAACSQRLSNVHARGGAFPGTVMTSADGDSAGRCDGREARCYNEADYLGESDDDLWWPARRTHERAGDKSISHRALLLGAIAEGRSHVENFLPAGDTLSTLRDLRTLGVDVADLSHTSLVVHGRGLHGLQEPGDVLDCGRSGTSIRLLAGLLAGQSFVSILTGDPQLRRRPMGRIVEPLRRMGATVLGRDGGRLPPIVILGGALHGIDYMLPVASAQVKSSLLLAGLYGDGRTTLHVPGSVRDHTERMLVAMGCGLEIGDGQLTLEPGIPFGQWMWSYQGFLIGGIPDRGGSAGPRLGGAHSGRRGEPHSHRAAGHSSGDGR